MFGYKIIREEQYKKLHQQKEVSQQEFTFSPSQDYRSVGDAIVVQLDRFTNHEAAMKSFMHKFIDGMEDLWDSEQVMRMLSKMSSVINERMKRL